MLSQEEGTLLLPAFLEDGGSMLEVMPSGVIGPVTEASSSQLC